MNQKHIALFLAAIMLMSVFSFFLSSILSDDSNGEQNTDAIEAPGFDSISGAHMNADLNSIEDGLKITPDGVNTVSYINYREVYGTPLQILAPNITELYSTYGSMITVRYSAYNMSGNFAFEGHKINPEVINFQYATTEQPYNGYYLLTRNEQFYNVVGTPMLLGGKDSLILVIDVSSGNAASSDDFDKILSYTESGAQYQMLSSDDVLAEQHYLEFRNLEDGMYGRTEIFLEPADSVLENIETLQASSAERGLAYDFTVYEEEDVAVVEITANETNFYNLAMERFE